LLEKKVVGMEYLDPDRFENFGGEVADVSGYDGIGPTAHGRCYNVTVVNVWQHDRGLQGFPSRDQRVFKRIAHVCETVVHRLGVDTRMDLDDG
jgi:hypothetical protein